MRRRTLLSAAALCVAVFFCDGEALSGAPPPEADRLDGPCGAPQFTLDGRHLFIASCGGWIAKFDLATLTTVAQTRIALKTRGLAVSSDGKFVAIASQEPPTLVVLDADLQPVKRLEVSDEAKQRRSYVAVIRDAAPRRSFVAALDGINELWEISYDPAAPEIAAGLVHDYKLREGSFVSGFLNPRRTPLDAPIEDFRLLPDGHRLVAVPRGGGPAQVIHLDVRRRIASVDRNQFEALGEPELAGRLRAASGLPLEAIVLDRHGRYAVASLRGPAPALVVYDTSTLREVKRLSIPGAVGK